MDWLEKHLAIFPTPALVLVIGAGQGRDLPALSRHVSQRLVLVEPQPNWAVFLRRQTVVSPSAEVMECALDAHSGKATLKVFNFPELSSLQPDEALASLLPGAYQTAELEVETRTLGDITEELDVQADGDNWLIIDAPDVEATLLASLADETLRRTYDHIVLRTSRRVRVGEEAGFEALLNVFVEIGYRPLGAEDLSDGDWPRVHLQRLDESATQKEREALLRRTAEDAEQRLQSISAELERGKEAWQKEKRRLERTINETRSALELKDNELSRMTDELRKSRDRAGAIEASASAAQTTVEKLEQALESKTQELARSAAHHEAQREKLASELQALRADLSLALRMQALREADLKALQERYGEILEVRDRQHELLEKLGQRLGAASSYLKALNSPEGEAGDPEAAAGLVRVLAGDIEPSS